MTVEPKLLPIVEIYSALQQGQLNIPAYQRNFVWGIDQQKQLVNSILQGLYIGQVLIVETESPGRFDIVDGHQRLKTISDFIEHDFQVGDWTLPENDRQKFLNQLLSVCLIRGLTESNQAIEIFQLINTAGKPLTFHDLRRAKGRGCFADLVHTLSSELLQLPERDGRLSVCPWDRFHLFTENERAQREDQVLIARIILSVLLGRCQAQDDRALDDLYTPGSARYQDMWAMLEKHPASDLVMEITAVFAALMTATTETVSCTRETFYIVFSALYEILIGQKRKLRKGALLDQVFASIDPLIPQGPNTVPGYKSLSGYARYQIQQSCVEISDEGALLESILRRAKVETAGCEFKQGCLRLSEGRKPETSLNDQIPETLCGMANAHLMEPAYLFIGIADKEADAQRIALLDHIEPVKIAGHYIVGIDREASVMQISVEEYCRRIKDLIDHADLSRPLALSVLSNLDIVTCQGFSIVRLTVLPQKEISYFKDNLFIRKHSNTIQVTNPREIVAIAQSFLI